MIQVNRTYKIKDNDTIENIANILGLDIKELINYHNKRAESHEQIRNRIPDFLREIIIPKDGYVLKDGKEIWGNKNIAEPITIDEIFTGKLKSKPYEKDLFYGVLKTIKSGKKETTIAYQKSVRFYPKDEFGINYVSVDVTSKTFINNEEPSLVAEELALSCTKILYPIVFQIDKNCNILEIQNHQEILNRWKKQKVKNLDYYKGDTAKNYFESFEETITDKELCLYYLKNDWFYNLYFNTIYSTYVSEAKQKQETVTFPIISHTAGVEFTIKKEAKISEQNKRVRIDAKGFCSDKRTKTELESKLFFPSLVSNLPSIKGNYRTRYFLKPDNHKIQSAFLECSLELNKPKYVSISVSEITDISKIDRGSRHLKSIKQQEEKKPSFWKSIFS